MELAIVNGSRSAAFPQGAGICEMCGEIVIAKCGDRVIHHWAHKGRRNCDPWWENETQWHRNWKNRFPVECHEIVHVSADGEIHRADIKTSSGIYIEAQHSAISDTERLARERFYKNLAWVVDGSAFKKQFDIYHKLPEPKSELARDLIWFKAKRHRLGCNAGMFHRQSIIDADTEKFGEPSSVSQVFGLRDIQSDVEASYVGHHQYDWVKPRSTWLEATCPVYIDFGPTSTHLARLEVYDTRGLPCVRLIPKEQFVSEAKTRTSVRDIAT